MQRRHMELLVDAVLREITMSWGLRAQITELEAHVKMLNDHIDFQREALLWWQGKATALHTKTRELEQALAQERRTPQKEDA